MEKRSEKMDRQKRINKAKALLAVLFLFVLIPISIYADTNFTLDQTVLFGITCSEDGQYIPVFENAGSKNKTDLLFPDTLCALVNTTLQGKYYWYQIVYMDQDGEPQTGFVKENNFEQLTVSTLTDQITDPEKKSLLDQFITLSETSPLFIQTTKAALPQGNQKQQYVLNTNTNKFHYPDCKSVKQMKEKNKKLFTGTREEIINMGYAPCKNCNP